VSCEKYLYPVDHLLQLLISLGSYC
jgi:hypothetical protein